MTDKIKLLILDIDGTLITYDSQEIPESTIKAVKQAQDKGYKIAIATGRTFFFIPKDVKELINPDYFVTINGACLTDNSGNILENYQIEQESCHKLLDYCRKHEINFAFKYKEFMRVHGNFKEYADAYLGRYKDNIHFLSLNDDEPYHFETEQPMGAFMFADHSHFEPLREMFSDYGLSYGNGNTLEIFPKGINKTKTIENIINAYGLTWDNVLTVGDGGNDIEMLEKAAIGIAMGNASDYVKGYADYVTTSVEDDGIYNAFKEFKII